MSLEVVAVAGPVALSREHPPPDFLRPQDLAASGIVVVGFRNGIVL